MNNDIFETPDYDGCGIYAIVNVRKMICYIGSSRDIKSRAINHRIALRRGKHANKILQKDYNEKCDFKFIILCRLERGIRRYCPKYKIHPTKKMDIHPLSAISFD